MDRNTITQIGFMPSCPQHGPQNHLLWLKIKFWNLTKNCASIF